MIITLHPHLLLGLAGLFGSLGLASGIVAAQTLAHPERDYSERRLRVRTWWPIMALFAAAMLLERTGAILLLATVSFLAFREFLSLVPLRRADHPILLAAYLVIPLQYGSAWLGTTSGFHYAIPVFATWVLLAGMVLVGDPHGYLRAAGMLLFGLLLTVYGLSHLALLPAIALPGDGPGWAGLLFYVVVLTEANDVAQYVWGKALGRTKILPRVSPGKTAGGLTGGVLTTSLLALLLAPWFTPLTLPAAAIAGLMIGVGGFFGDAVFSAVKRDLGIKQSGDLLPGHGGILDRIDSLTFTAPLFVLALPVLLP